MCLNTLKTYLGSTFVNLFNKFNQVFQVYVQADAPYRLHAKDIEKLYVRNGLGEMVPLGTFMDFNTPWGPNSSPATTSIPRRPSRDRRAGIQFRTGPEPDGTGGGKHPAARHGLRLDGHGLPGKAGRPPGLLHLRPSIVLVFMVLAALYESWTTPGRSFWWCPWPWWGCSWP